MSLLPFPRPASEEVQPPTIKEFVRLTLELLEANEAKSFSLREGLARESALLLMERYIVTGGGL